MTKQAAGVSSGYIHIAIDRWSTIQSTNSMFVKIWAQRAKLMTLASISGRQGPPIWLVACAT